MKEKNIREILIKNKIVISLIQKLFNVLIVLTYKTLI